MAAKLGGIAAAGLGGLTARVGATQRGGVFQEAAPATAPGVDAGHTAGQMAEVAADRGAAVLVGYPRPEGQHPGVLS